MVDYGRVGFGVSNKYNQNLQLVIFYSFFQNYKYLVFHLGRHIFDQRIEASILIIVLKNL